MITIDDAQINEEIVYYIADDKYFNIPDREIAKMLNIDYELYIEIMKKYGAMKYRKDYYFYNHQDAINCLNDENLQSYLMMYELIKK